MMFWDKILAKLMQENLWPKAYFGGEAIFKHFGEGIC